MASTDFRVMIIQDMIYESHNRTFTLLSPQKLAFVRTCHMMASHHLLPRAMDDYDHIHENEPNEEERPRDIKIKKAIQHLVNWHAKKMLAST